jgi:hypothetical protein
MSAKVGVNCIHIYFIYSFFVTLIQIQFFIFILSLSWLWVAFYLIVYMFN